MRCQAKTPHVAGLFFYPEINYSLRDFFTAGVQLPRRLWLSYSVGGLSPDRP